MYNSSLVSKFLAGIFGCCLMWASCIVMPFQGTVYLSGIDGIANQTFQPEGRGSYSIKGSWVCIKPTPWLFSRGSCSGRILVPVDNREALGCAVLENEQCFIWIRFRLRYEQCWNSFFSVWLLTPFPPVAQLGFCQSSGSMWNAAHAWKLHKRINVISFEAQVSREIGVTDNSVFHVSWVPQNYTLNLVAGCIRLGDRIYY